MEHISNKERKKGIYKITLVGSLVNFILVLLKLAAGILGRSSAMIADAIHSTSDFVTDIIVLFFIKISGKPKDDGHKYGHGKYETLATLIIGFILLIAGVMIAFNGSKQIVEVVNGKTIKSPGMLAFWVAIFSIVSKEIIYRYTIASGKKLNSGAVIANAWHHRSDAFSSIGTAVGIGGAIFLGEKWTVLDPIAAVVVSIFIVRTAILLMKPAIDELIERALPPEVENEIIKLINSCDNISDLHNLYTRKIGNKYAIEFHVRMDGNTTLEETHNNITLIEKKLREKYGPDTHIMIHMEPLKYKHDN